MHPDIAVVGAGVVGACAALRLAQAGARVTVLEADHPGSGTSARSFAWVGASPRGLWPYFAINAAGMAAHRRLRAELGGAPWLTLTGSLAWFSDPERGPEVAARVAELRDAGYPSALISAAAAVCDLEPDLRLPPDVEHVAFHPDEGFAAVLPMIREVLDAAHRLGAEVRAPARAVAIETAGDRVAGVRLEGGESLRAGRVVVCCGRHSGGLLATAGVHLPMLDPAEPGSPAVGLLALTAPSGTRLSRLLHADDLMARPDGAGRLLLHSDPHDARLAGGAEDARALAGEVLAEAGRHLRLAGPARLESHRVGFRALTADRLPAVGWTGGPEGLYVAATHSGVTLAPVLGEIIAREVAGGADEALPAGLRPTRFAPAESTPHRDGVPHA